MVIGIIIPNNAKLLIDFVRSLLTISDKTIIWNEGACIAENRNLVFERARILQDNLLFIDSDIVFTREQVNKIEKHLEKYDIVTGYTGLGFPGFPPSIFVKNEKGQYKLASFPDKEELFEIDACGAPFLGISKKVLNTLVTPFHLILDKNTGRYHGEDISFCINAKKNGFKIICDPSLSVGHIRTVTRYCEV